MPHRLDPPIQTEAARRLGKLMAQGVVAYEDVLPQLVDAAVRLGGYSGCLSGLQSRLAGTLRECADHWRIERDKAEWFIRQDALPRAAAWTDPDEITRAAHQINEARGEPLLRPEVVAIVDEVLEVVLQRAAREQYKNKKRGRRHVR